MSRRRALDERQAREVAQLVARGERLEMLAEKYGVSTRTIARVIARERERARDLSLDELLEQLCRPEA